jgi:hypothetical protein
MAITLIGLPYDSGHSIDDITFHALYMNGSSQVLKDDLAIEADQFRLDKHYLVAMRLAYSRHRLHLLSDLYLSIRQMYKAVLVKGRDFILW